MMWQERYAANRLPRPVFQHPRDLEQPTDEDALVVPWNCEACTRDVDGVIPCAKHREADGKRQGPVSTKVRVRRARR